MSARDSHWAGELPWGWWLRSRDGALEDEDGRRWKSVREAFWQGELGFADVHFAEEQHELLLRVLSSKDAGRFGRVESQHDIFGGDLTFRRFYLCWLASIGMLGKAEGVFNRNDPFSVGLSPAGRSALMMLRATRNPAWEPLPMTEVIDAVIESDRGDAERARDDALQTFEASIGLRRHVFARERIGASHLITLTSMEAGTGARMPVRRVTWSISFCEPASRDHLYAWLAARIGRWDDWGQMAYRKGADVFSQHLLSLLVASQIDGESW